MPTVVQCPTVLKVCKAQGGKQPWTYSSVQGAIDAADDIKRGDTPLTILIGPGVYKEQVDIPKKAGRIILRGEKGREPKITFGAYTGQKITNPRLLGGDKDHYSTYSSASVAVGTADLVAVHVIFENCAGQRCGGATGQNQAVALRVSADRASFYGCTFLGWQDTLYIHKGSAFFLGCRVEGTVDFIFGANCRAYFQDCDLHFRDKGWLTAHGRNLDKNPDDHGSLVLDSCTISAASGVEAGSAFLGRPWGPDARVVVHQCSIPPAVSRAGWSPWNADTDLLRPAFLECACHGPGAIQGKGEGRVMGRKAASHEMCQYVPAANFFKGMGSFPALSAP